MLWQKKDRRNDRQTYWRARKKQPPTTYKIVFLVPFGWLVKKNHICMFFFFFKFILDTFQLVLNNVFVKNPFTATDNIITPDNWIKHRRWEAVLCLFATTGFYSVVINHSVFWVTSCRLTLYSLRRYEVKLILCKI